jgi:membrane peptidoglycan carboxypeptidase
MQLVKMLFLDQDRILSRKLQEVFLVYLMEQEVPVAKSRILELYLNVVEFGPGVFGIADAARYYFNRSPAELSAGEATWLASILPAPKRYHDYYEAGGISPGWFERMKGLYDIMLERGRMTESEYEQAVQAPPRFAPGSGSSD